MNHHLNLLNTVVDRSDGRNTCRYKLEDNEFWHLNCDNKRMPSKWIVNLSEVGASIRIGRHAKYQVGDVLPIRVQYYGDTVVDEMARVMWVKPYENSLNMEQLGLEYIKQEKATNLVAKPEHNSYLKLKKIFSAKTESAKQYLQINATHYVYIATFMFAVGYFLTTYKIL